LGPEFVGERLREKMDLGDAGCAGTLLPQDKREETKGFLGEMTGRRT